MVRFTPHGAAAQIKVGSHWKGDCVDPRALLDILENEKSIAATEIQTQECLASSLVTTGTKISQFQNWLCTALKKLFIIPVVFFTGTG